VNSFRQIQQHFMQHGSEMNESSSVLTSSTSNSSINNNYSPVKNHRSQQGAIRERKRTLRSAPNGY
jgi:hypothetical protein